VRRYGRGHRHLGSEGRVSDVNQQSNNQSHFLSGDLRYLTDGFAGGGAYIATACLLLAQSWALSHWVN